METEPQNEEQENDQWLVYKIPDSLLLNIFNNLDAHDVGTCARVCTKWRSVAYDESLWKDLVYRQWNIGGKICPGHHSWRAEYKRLYYYAPLMWSETLTDHSDEVLHICFSHNGAMFSTTSKDCTVKVWLVDYPTRLKYDYNFREEFSWDFTQFSCFNDDDSLLLVSSVKSTEIDRRGFVAVLSITHNFELVRVVSMDPSQMFGTWLSASTFLGGSLEISLDRFATTVQIQAFEVNNSKQALSPGTVEPNSGLALFTFCSETASLIKFLTVVNIPDQGISPIHETEYERSTDSTSFPQTCDLNANKSNCVKADLRVSGKKELRQGEQLCNNNVSKENGPMDTNSDNICGDSDVKRPPKRSRSVRNNYKVRNLIYVTGEFAVALHQLGFKDVSPNTVSDIAGERTLESAVTDFENIPSHMVVNYSNQNIEMRRIRTPDLSDHMIDLNGHVTGLCISQDHRYLFVNCRPWIGSVDRSDPWATPELSPEIEVRVIDLHRLTDTGVRYRGHKGFSQSTMCCFVFLDSSLHYVGSGSEDMQAYLWDRHYQCILGTFTHGPGVVNAVGFSPVDEEYFVTVSDDHTIKIWRSRHRQRQLSQSTPS